jgi:diguanylate cyclase
MDDQITLDFSLGYAAFFTGIAATLVVRKLKALAAPTGEASEATPDPDAQAAQSKATEASVRELRDVAQNMACDVNAHRLLVEGVSARLGESLAAETQDEKLILNATVELLDANFELQSRLVAAERKISVQEQELTSRQLEAETDPLTRLPNRRAFDAALQRAVADLNQKHRPFSVVMLDVDYFKQFNDAHGHVAGDEVLRTLGQRLPQLIKSTDSACRYGGEEFAVILHGARLLEAQTAANRIRAAIEGMAVDIEGSTLSITASFGVAEGVPGEDGRKVISRADECVYASKRQGRNCTHWHNGAGCVLAAERRHKSSVRRFFGGGNRATPAVDRLSVLGQSPIIPDRAVLFSLLQRRVAESARSNEPLSVIQFAIQIDQRPHDAAQDADQIESAVVAALACSLRDMDYLGRSNENQFTIILPRCTEPAAKIVAQRLIAVAKSATKGLASRGVSFSAGVAAVEHPMSAEQALELAKRQLPATTAAV